MFGLENQKKSAKDEAFVFDLEKSLMNHSYSSEMKTRIEKNVQKIKEGLRSGEAKEDFESLGILLHGYAALVKVFGRVGLKKKA